MAAARCGAHKSIEDNFAVHNMFPLTFSIKMSRSLGWRSVVHTNYPTELLKATVPHATTQQTYLQLSLVNSRTRHHITTNPCSA